MAKRTWARGTDTSADLADLESHLDELIDELDFPELEDLCENAWLLELVLIYCKRRHGARS